MASEVEKLPVIKDTFLDYIHDSEFAIPVQNVHLAICGTWKATHMDATEHPPSRPGLSAPTQTCCPCALCPLI